MSRLWHISFLLAALFCAGCFSNPVEEIRSHGFVDGMTVAQAYDSLLDNSAWEKVRIDGTNFVQVKGIIKGSTDTLLVRYERKPRPPVVAAFELNGSAQEASAFAKFLYDLQLRRAIMMPEPAS